MYVLFVIYVIENRVDRMPEISDNSQGQMMKNHWTWILGHQHPGKAKNRRFE